MRLEPPGGWTAFSRSQALKEAIWERLPQTEWDYLNLASGSSIWENRRDGSYVALGYADRDGPVMEFVGDGGAAAAFARQIAAEFGLVEVRSAS